MSFEIDGIKPDPAAARDKQWMQEMCELVKNKIPESHTFVVFAFPISTDGRCYYGSNATRESSVAALREWLEYQRKVDNWMTHDEGPPPPAPWPKPPEAQRAPIELNAAQESLAKQWAMDKDYLGDSVYAQHDGHHIILTTENGYPDDPRNQIALEPQVLTALNCYVQRIKSKYSEQQPL